MRGVLFLLTCLVLIDPGRAAAGEGALTARGDAAADDARPNTVYLELFGGGTVYGIGYERALTPRFGVGAVVSAAWIDGERILSLAPYLAARLVGDGAHRWFAHAGPQVVDRAIGSPVPGWDGARDTAVAAQLATGYELRTRVVLRGFVQMTAGRGGVAPWVGLSAGLSF